MDVPLIAITAVLAAVTLAATVEMLRGRPWVGRACAPVLLGRLLVVAGATTSLVCRLVAGRSLVDRMSVADVLGAGLVTAGLVQLAAHWVRESSRAAAERA